MEENPVLERVACPLCRSDDEAALFVKDGFTIVRCRCCRLVYVNPRLAADAQSNLYRQQAISPASYYLRTERQDERSFAARLRLIERFCARGRLLDLGCGPGAFSVAARARGWRTVGLDVNPESVARCRDRGLEVVCDSFPSTVLAGERFDAVVMNDFLEHLADPGAALLAVAQILAAAGVLFLSTPDIGSRMARLTGRRWLHLKPNEHLIYFDRRTITALLVQSGFRAVHLQSVGRVRNLAVALEKVRAYGEWPSRLGQALVPRWLSERVSIPLNLGDEMAVVAVRA